MFTIFLIFKLIFDKEAFVNFIKFVFVLLLTLKKSYTLINFGLKSNTFDEVKLSTTNKVSTIASVSHEITKLAADKAKVKLELG